MIYVTHAATVNAAGKPSLDRAAVWDGLVLKANNALPFIPTMTYCQVTARHSDTVFDREIEFREQRFTERITPRGSAPGGVHPYCRPSPWHHSERNSRHRS